MSVVYCTRAALTDMIESGWGRIINVASVAGVYGNAKMVHYSATKGALISMTKALAKEVAEKGILVKGEKALEKGDIIQYRTNAQGCSIAKGLC